MSNKVRLRSKKVYSAGKMHKGLSDLIEGYKGPISNILNKRDFYVTSKGKRTKYKFSKGLFADYALEIAKFNREQIPPRLQSLFLEYIYLELGKEII